MVKNKKGVIQLELPPFYAIFHSFTLYAAHLSFPVYFLD